MSGFTENLSDFEESTLELLRDNLPLYAEECLEIKLKAGGTGPLTFNRVQWYLHNEIEQQKREMGFVRIIIIKGRQQTCSTYVAARFYHAAQFNSAISVYIMAHEVKATKALFEKIQIFDDGMQANFSPLVHETEIENRLERRYMNNSTYTVGTAGEGETGRSLTANRFHGSEAALWEQAQKIKAGALQTVELKKWNNTEIILESTAQGMNWLYTMAMDARAGLGVYRVVFIPWVWTDEYMLEFEPGEIFVRTEEESKVAKILWNVHKWRVTDEQLNWRRAKIVELGEVTFKQEYPNTFEEAFQYSTQGFYPMDKVYEAFERKDVSNYGARILGVDVGRSRIKNPNGKPDRTVLFGRCGYEVDEITTYPEMTAPQLAGILCQRIDKGEVDHIFIDWAIGGATYEIMVDKGYGRWITAVDFGESPMDPQYANKRAEMGCNVEEWLGKHVSIKPMYGCKDEQEMVQRQQALSADMSMMPYWKLNNASRKQFPSKDKMRDEYGRSPDILDAFMLTFAYPVAAPDSTRATHTVNTQGGSALYAQRQRQGLAAKRSTSYTEPRRDPRLPGKGGRRFINKYVEAIAA